jgi:formylmethanofuran dehydrogenase subunit B
MVESDHQGRRLDVGCPFCGLICDDLTIDVGDGGLQVIDAGCWLSRRSFEDRAPLTPAMVAGRPAETAAAVGRAAEILSRAQAPVFMVSADIAGARAALRLADRLGGVVDHPDSDALFRNFRAQQDAGAFTTTLSEVRNRADLVLVVGPDPAAALPRFYERCVEPQRTLLGDQPLRRQLFRLGPPVAASTADGSAPPPATELPCAAEDLPAAIAVLGALLRGKQIASPEIPGLDNLAESLKAARYAVLVWVPSLFPAAGGELMAQAMLEIVRTLNLSTRAFTLALGGSGNLLGVNQLCLWQSGYPLRTSFGSGTPEHVIYRFSGRRMVAEGEAAALVWITAFGAAEPSMNADVPTIVLAPRLAPQADSPAVHIPVGMPGIDHAGQVIRSDVVVALRLAALRDATAPSVGAVLAMVEAQLSGKGTAS